MRAAKVLVIDDDTSTRRRIKSILEDAGYMVIQSSNGRHGWETLWENPDIQLLVADMTMPDMDGAELLQLVRGTHSFAALPAIVVSESPESEAKERFSSLGPCQCCLAEPQNVSEAVRRFEAMGYGVQPTIPPLAKSSLR